MAEKTSTILCCVMGMDGGELQSGAEATTASAAELDAARNDFHRALPHRSAKRVFFVTQALALIILLAALVLAFWAAPALSIEVAHIAALAVFAMAIALRLVAAASLTPTLSRLAEPEHWPIYTILCPLYREANVGHPNRCACYISPHFRTDILRASGGWDSHNVTEDADLGYRFARDGHRIDVMGPPTYEEAPVTFSAWLNQRTRWIKGHMQTWLVLMRDPIKTAREMGLTSFATLHLMLSGGLAAAFLHGPIACILVIAILSPYTLLTPADFVLAICGYSVAIFAALTACALSNSLSHARAAPTMPAYWPLASIAAYRALFELLFRPHHWAKTARGVSPRARFTQYRTSVREGIIMSDVDRKEPQSFNSEISATRTSP